MRSTKTGLGILVVLAMAMAAEPRGQAPLAPRISCAAVEETQGAQAGQPIKTSNLKRIQMRVTLTGPPETTDELRLALAAASGGGALAPTLEVVVVRVSGQNARSRVEMSATVNGQGMNPTEQYVNVALEIPIDGATRRQNIERFLARAEAEITKVGRIAEFRALTQDREAAIAVFDRLYFENAVGDFEVTCKYSSRRRGFWNGDVESSPIRLQIVSEGRFFDQPAFR